jgi:hypothetical protein
LKLKKPLASGKRFFFVHGERKHALGYGKLKPNVPENPRRSSLARNPRKCPQEGTPGEALAPPSVVEKSYLNPA